ncbi:unnamed protein product [Microthlaspi erraticum]|uniref:Transposase, Ptta/En/Spm, plant n=1 Tax=Microthlaspi erraticum TaxID=1685480 RepID=A0A6D2HJG3_9BRAS|nr:unnamed protein product [Microthlaspi erraticum]
MEDFSPEMEEAVVDRSVLPMLHPSRENGAKWFNHDTQVSTAVRKVIQSCFKGPYYSWKKVPPFYKGTWFSLFKKKFNWNPAINHQVKGEFDKLAAYRLKGMISAAKKDAQKTGEKPDWIMSDVWAIMEAHWATAKAIEKSAKARASRMSDRGGIGPYSHVAGSRSFAKVQDVLEANNEDFCFFAVMKKTHQKADGTYSDQRARLVAEAYEKHLEEHLGQLEIAGEQWTAENLGLREKNEIYVKAATGVSNQGIFGLGALRSEVLLAGEASSSAPQLEEPEMCPQRMQEMETELKESREENLQIQRRLEALEKKLESLERQNA